jgi:hypothetical protein
MTHITTTALPAVSALWERAIPLSGRVAMHARTPLKGPLSGRGASDAIRSVRSAAVRRDAIVETAHGEYP